MSAAQYLDICSQVRAANVRLKINTVVTLANCGEDLNEFIIEAKPNRWKIMQMVPIDGFYDNIGAEYAYSQPIPEVGVEEALAQVQVSHWKFSARGGYYGSDLR